MVASEEVIRKVRRPLAPQVTLTLTGEILADAQRRDSSHCMWAEAVKAAVPHAEHVAVDLQTIRFTDPSRGLRYSYLTPRKAQVSLIRFDQGLETPVGLTVKLRDGQVTKARNYEKVRRPKNTEMPDGHKTVLHTQRPSGEVGDVPVVVGGTPPPMGPLASPSYRGKKRRYGLRILEA
jgi:hypothetical protein